MTAALQESVGQLHYSPPAKGRRFRVPVAHDLAAAALSFPIAILLRLLGQPIASHEFLPLLLYGMPLFVVLSLISFKWFGVENAFWRYTDTFELLTIFEAVTCAILLFAAAWPLVEPIAAPMWAVLAIQWFVLVGLLCGSRLIYAGVFASRRARQASVCQTDWKPVIVVGADDMAALLIELLITGRKKGRFEIVGLLDDRPDILGRVIHSVVVLDTIRNLPQAVARLAIHGIVPRYVVLTLPPDRIEGQVLERLRRAASDVKLPILSTDEFIRLAIAEGAIQRQITRAEEGQIERSTSLNIKRAVDVLGAAVLIAAFAPIMLLIMLLIWSSFGSPVIFDQVRPGKGLRPFTLYKFRTLRDGCTLDGRVLPDSERRTLVGDLLRQTRLDELPQLWNVLAGDMSFIGPRPLLLSELPNFGETLHTRFFLRPGITGWAQVNGGRLLTTEQKLALDFWYISHHSLRLDLEIVVRTAWMVIFGERLNEVTVRHMEMALASMREKTPPEASEFVAHGLAPEGGQ
jgi:lipopolysaccharide/colanic/teichoic acid biosynthesis glycosyltransferase